MIKHAKSGRVRLLLQGLGLGFAFGFLLQKGGATSYDVIMGQLRLLDFTMVKIMLSAVIVGMIGVHGLLASGKVRFYPKQGFWGTSLPGGLLFGVGFGLLGYCPGTLAGAVGEGRLDALLGGVVGILLGAGLFSLAYCPLKKKVLGVGDFGDRTLPEIWGVSPWRVVLPMVFLMILFLILIERVGL